LEVELCREDWRQWFLPWLRLGRKILVSLPVLRLTGESPMKVQVADLICKVLTREGVVHTRDSDYSGRGMMGDTTEAIIMGSRDAFMYAAGIVSKELPRTNVMPLDEFKSHIDAIRVDNMGKSDVVIY
jgi:hypothetical protein